jgi:hypothetical protein
MRIGYKRRDFFERKKGNKKEQFIEVKDRKDRFILGSKTAENYIKKIPTSVSYVDLISNFKQSLLINQDKDERQITMLFVCDNIYN